MVAMIYKDAVLYLHFDKERWLADASGTGNDAIMLNSGNNASNASGIIGEALRFNDPAHHISFASTVTPVGAKTVNLWVNFANLSRAGGGGLIQYLYANQQGNIDKSGLYLRSDGAGLTVILRDGTNNIFSQTYTNVFTKDTWNFVSFAWDGTTNANAIRVRVNDQTFSGTSTGTETLSPSWKL